ncbi:phosphotransferase [Promicromonospora sukumoe]|uniref:phosphotransferase n=1 Tax=Promicromonospora sukumoe TaxID=88382 RepID=UPI0037CC8AE5
MSSTLVGISPTPVEVPPVVHNLAGRLRPVATVVPVWRNEYGGFTARLEDSARLEDRTNAPGRTTARAAGRSSYLKWVPHGSACPDPFAEADRLVWAGSFAPLPRVLDVGRNRYGSWLLTEAVERDGAIATSAIEPRWRSLAKRSAIAIGLGLRRLHDLLPVDTCSFVRTAELRVAALTRSAAVTLCGTPLADPPPVDRLVVCHGDATVPNTLLDRAGRFVAHVDVGDLGVADRWSDIAVTTRSVTRRYGPGLEPLVLAAYGVAPDPVRTRYYRALWDAEEAVRVRRVAQRSEPRYPDPNGRGHLRRAS